MRKLKIAVLGTRGFPFIQGGVEKHCEKLYPLVAKLGAEVTVFTRAAYISEEKIIKGWNGVNFIRLWCPRHKFLEAIIHTFLGVLRARFLSPDILHIHAIGPSLLVPFARILCMKVVITHHGPDYEREKWGKLARLILRLGEFTGVKFADRVIVISKYIKSIIEEKYGRSDLAVIPNGIDMPEILPADGTLRSFNLEPRKYVFTACRFVPEKGLYDLIEAYRMIEKPEFKLVIAGGADHETDYSRRIKDMARDTFGVILTGVLTGKPLQELYSNAGLFVLPSYYEGLPIALLEALSYGLPVLASDIPQNRGISLPDFRYFPCGNKDILTKKMTELFRRGISEEEKANQGAVLKENYNWDKIAQQTFEVYKSIINFA